MTNKVSLKFILVVASLLLFSTLLFGQNETPEPAKNELQLALEKAEAARAAGDLDTALRLFDAVLEKWPMFDMGYAGKGFTYLNRKNPANALTNFEKEASLSQKNFGWRILIAVVQMDLNKFEDALVSATEAIKLGADDVKIYMLRGWINFYLKKNEDAVADFTTALSKDRSANEGFLGRGRAFLNLEKYKEAKEDLTAYISKDDSNAEAYFYRACAYEGLNEPESAIDDYALVLKLDPDNWRVLSVGVICWRIQNVCAKHQSISRKHIDLILKIQNC